MSEALKPCPFCGLGGTVIVPGGRVWTGMKYGEPTSVSVRHWCPAVKGQPARMIERVGRDEASAIAAWNDRVPIAAPSGGDWEGLFDKVALALHCLPSSFVDGNDHVVAAANGSWSALQSEDKRDAERYRWLRNTGIVEYAGAFGGHSAVLPNGEMLDSKIDAARASTGDKA
jgi:hypothetical protein